MITRLLSVLILACLAVTPSLAATTGTLEGHVTDAQNGARLVGVNVILAGARVGTVTDDAGFYRIHNLRAGTYEVTVSMIGYTTIIDTRVIIRPDRHTVFDVPLSPSTIRLRTVDVTGERELIQTDVMGTAHQLDPVVLRERPTDTVEQVVGLQPGTTVEGNIRGGKPREAIYLIDGLPVQDVIAGGLGTDLPLSAVAQMTVNTGGFGAEYGNAQSGVINIVTRSGADTHEGSLRLGKDDLFGGTEVSHHNELEVALSGPLRRGSLHYLSANRLVLTDTRFWQDLQHAFDSPVQRELNGVTKLDWQLTNQKRLTTELVYSLRRWRDYEFTWRYNLDGLPRRQRDSHRASVHWNHTLSPSLFYNASLSRYSLHNRIGREAPPAAEWTPYDYDFHLLYIVEGDRNWWAETRQSIYRFKADATHQAHRAHLLSGGFELEQFDIESAVRKLEPQLTYFGRPLIYEPPLNYSNSYHYYPRSGSAYIEDRMEGVEGGSVATFGLRLDFLDPRARRPAVELVPLGGDEYDEFVTGSVPADLKVHLSPRFGCSFPLDDRSFFFLNWGHYVQYPLFDHLYSGLHNENVRGGVNALRGNPDLLAERTQIWEVSIRYDLGDGVLASLAYYNKETRDQVDTKTFVATNSRIAGDYGFAAYVNNPFATSSGFEAAIRRDQGGLRGSLSYAYAKARGFSDYEDQGLNFAQWGFAVANTPFFLSWDQRHTLKLDLRMDLPAASTAALVWHAHTGRPYTYYPSADGFTPDNGAQPFIPNNRRMDAYNLISVKLSRAWSFGSGMAVTLYVDSRNLLDQQNVRWVDSSGREGGELQDPSAYYIPRRTLVGLEIDL